MDGITIGQQAVKDHEVNIGGLRQGAGIFAGHTMPDREIFTFQELCKSSPQFFIVIDKCNDRVVLNHTPLR